MRKWPADRANAHARNEIVSVFHPVAVISDGTEGNWIRYRMAMCQSIPSESNVFRTARPNGRRPLTSLPPIVDRSLPLDGRECSDESIVGVGARGGSGPTGPASYRRQQPEAQVRADTYNARTRLGEKAASGRYIAISSVSWRISIGTTVAPCASPAMAVCASASCAAGMRAGEQET